MLIPEFMVLPGCLLTAHDQQVDDKYEFYYMKDEGKCHLLHACRDVEHISVRFPPRPITIASNGWARFALLFEPTAKYHLLASYAQREQRGCQTLYCYYCREA